MSVPLQASPYPVSKDRLPQASYLSGVTALLSGYAEPMGQYYDKLHHYRGAVSNPGNVESLGRDVKMTHLTNFTFDGAKADLSKVLSTDPAFQVQHSFNLASATQPPSYNFGAVYAMDKLFLRGSIDNDMSSSAQLNRTWNQYNTSKLQAQLSPVPGHSMIQLEHELTLPGETISLKTINPSLTDGSGIYITSVLAAVHPQLSLGFENVYQKAQDAAQSTPSFLAKLTSPLQPASPFNSPPGSPPFHEWTATLQYQAQGILAATYHHKLSPNVDVAADLNIVTAGGRREATATVGAKYEFRQSTFRGQLDSTGKTSMLLEQRFAPQFSFLVTGEIDHMKAGAAKVGLGVMIESATEELTQQMMAQQQAQQQAQGP